MTVIEEMKLAIARCAARPEVMERLRSIVDNTQCHSECPADCKGCVLDFNHSSLDCGMYLLGGILGLQAEDATSEVSLAKKLLEVLSDAVATVIEEEISCTSTTT